MTNHEFGAKLLTRIVLPDLAGIGEDRNCLHPGFRFQITDGSGCHARKFGVRPSLRQSGASQYSVLKKAAKEKFGTDVTHNEAEQAIADYFDPTIPPPDIPQDQIEEIVESMWGDNSY
jgi:hypothetical protein